MASNMLITKSFKAVKNTRDRTTEKQSDDQVGDIKPSTSRTDTEEELRVLKQFDVTLEFGPCTGITRLERWERAEKHGLNPPTVVKDILNKHPNDEEYIQCLWKDYPL